MDESILNTIKKMLGPDEGYDVFDTELVIHINTAIATLTQIGVGPPQGFRITGAGETWTDYLGSDEGLENVKTYIYCKVKMIFDPPTSSFVMKALQDTCDELVWRLNVAVDPGNYRTETE